MSPRRHRLRTLAVALPLWIVMILTGGQWCLMPDSVAHPVVSSAAGVGHAGDAARAALESRAAAASGAGHGAAVSSAEGDAHHLHGAPPSEASHGGAGDHGQHGRDGASCESQAPCSVAIAATALQLSATPAPRPAEPHALVSARPRSLALAPELPPPRA